MISMEDCVAFSGMSEQEVLAIAEHEHVPEVVACAMAQYLDQNYTGRVQIRDMIVDDIRDAQEQGNRSHVRDLLHVLHHFLRTHPEERPTIHPWSQVF
jgi:hypothetical protein